jgi:hypothetical protein
MERRGEKIIESSVEARQGFLGRPVLVVLVVSCVRARCCCACGLICGCLRACLVLRRSSENAASGRPAPGVDLFPAVRRTDQNSRRRPYAISLVPRQDSPEVLANSAQPRGPHISIGAAREIVHQPDVRKPILITAGFFGCL